MTAVIGVLNKSAVALAADSAVTISGPNGHKIYNTANKIFRLSKYHPIAIMLYNSAYFMMTPWELIIKLYRDQLADRHFNTVKEYQEDFINYVKNTTDFSSKKAQKLVYQNLAVSFLNMLTTEAITGNDYSSIQEEEKAAAILGDVEKKIEEYLEYYKGHPLFADFENFEDQDVFIKEFETEFNAALNTIFTSNGYVLPIDLTSKLRRALLGYIRLKHFGITGWTGLVFAGYGEQEIYPSCVHIKVGEFFRGKLRYEYDEEQSVVINDDINGAVRPFAQTDVIHTLISGIDPQLENIYRDTFKKFYEKFDAFYKQAYPEITADSSTIDVESLYKEYVQEMDNIQRRDYIQPTMNTVSILNKEDLAEMAESLIYITYLKRRISSAEESVGGPVDVALISKGDGFIWLKRKHYFKPELNHHFFDIYLNRTS